jgi:16S rRNA (cytosine1402-N4)-methyltransferase
VNDELGEIERALPRAVASLAPRGRLVVISFHSLEDRIVKRYMRDASREDPAWAGLPQVPATARPRLRLVGRATFAGEAEVAQNPRARSAVMRVAERLPA